MHELDFMLPPHVRTVWVSDAAHETWKPRLARIEAALRDVAWMSVAEGIRKCAVIEISPTEHVISGVHWLKKGLWYVPVEYQESPAFRGFSENDTSVPYVLRIAVAKKENLLGFVDALNDEDGDAIQSSIGWPKCCRIEIECKSAEFGFIDPLWSAMLPHVYSVDALSPIVVSGPPHTNVFLRCIGLSILLHVPCSAACSNSIGLAEQLLEMGKNIGYSDEMGWLLEVLSWPVEWSTLHGIVEIKTPILKISATTDARAEKYVVHRKGTRYPSEGAQALTFPYAMGSAQQKAGLTSK